MINIFQISRLGCSCFQKFYARLYINDCFKIKLNVQMDVKIHTITQFMNWPGNVRTSLYLNESFVKDVASAAPRKNSPSNKNFLNTGLSAILLV